MTEMKRTLCSSLTEGVQLEKNQPSKDNCIQTIQF